MGLAGLKVGLGESVSEWRVILLYTTVESILYTVGTLYL